VKQLKTLWETKRAIFLLVDTICGGASAGEVDLSVEKLKELEPSLADYLSHSVVPILPQFADCFTKF
jgi:hypothetical protein